MVTVHVLWLQYYGMYYSAILIITVLIRLAIITVTVIPAVILIIIYTIHAVTVILRFVFLLMSLPGANFVKKHDLSFFRCPCRGQIL